MKDKNPHFTGGSHSLKVLLLSPIPSNYLGINHCCDPVRIILNHPFRIGLTQIPLVRFAPWVFLFLRSGEQVRLASK